MEKETSSANLSTDGQEATSNVEVTADKPTDNKKPKSFLKTFLIILVTFLLSSIITLGGLTYYVYKYNPFNIQACLISGFLSTSSLLDSKASESLPSASGGTTNTAPTKFDHPLLSPEQETMLEDAGVDVSTLPTTLTPELEACGIKALGEDRINEIINGAAPSPLDLFRVKSCL